MPERHALQIEEIRNSAAFRAGAAERAEQNLYARRNITVDGKKIIAPAGTLLMKLQGRGH